MSTDSTIKQKQFLDWLRLVALESRNGVLQVQSNEETWRFYCLNGDIRAATVTPTTTLDSGRADPGAFFLKTLIALAVDGVPQCSFAEVREKPPPQALVARVPIETVLSELARTALAPEAIRAQLKASGSRFIALKSTGLENRAGVLSRDEVFLLSRFDSPLSVEEVLSVSPFEELQSVRHIYVLYLLGLVDAYDPRAAAAGTTGRSLPGFDPTPVAAPAMPPSRDEATDWLSLKREIEELSSAISGGDFYDLLGVTRKSSPEEIKARYYKLAKRFHPDRYKARAPESLHSQLVDLFRQLTTAYQALSDPTQRAEYDRRQASQSFKKDAPTPSSPLISETERAERSFAEGKQLFEKGDCVRALPYFRDAANLEPSNGQYLSFLARTLSKVPQYRREAEDHFLKAIDLEPENPSHFLDLGNFYKEINLPSRARRAFEQALERDPSSEIAKEELKSTTGKPKIQKSFGKQLKKMFSKK
ncbi:MAG: DnaJ domain-containing protein [Acidobacteriia bacterium]|nr:DnaJ domain-containing protein [Terriglobia bacterium]